MNFLFELHLLELLRKASLLQVGYELRHSTFAYLSARSRA